MPITFIVFIEILKMQKCFHQMMSPKIIILKHSYYILLLKPNYSIIRDSKLAYDELILACILHRAKAYSVTTSNLQHSTPKSQNFLQVRKSLLNVLYRNHNIRQLQRAFS